MEAASLKLSFVKLASETKLFISPTTHSMSASVVLKLVMHARTTGTPPS